ncbi:MAG: RecB family exonuclease, partial [bacterium]
MLDISTTDSGDYRTLSASQINKFYNCSRMWAYEYIEGLKPPPTYPMKKGTYIHAVIEELNDSLGTIDDRSVQDLRVDIQEKALTIARDLWKKGIPGEFEEEMRENHSKIKDQFFNYIEALLQRYQDIKRRTELSAEDAWFRARPSANELSILVTNESGEWLFRGDIDSVFEKHPLWFDRTAIIDYKTGKSPFDDESPMSIEYSRHLDVYAWLYYQAFGSVPEVAGIHFLAEPPSNSTSFMYKEIDPGTIESTHMMLNRVRELATSEDLEDYNRNTQFKWCEF